MAIELEPCECRGKCPCAYTVALLGTFLIVAALVWVMVVYTRPAPLGEDRAPLRRKNLKDLRDANADVLNTPNYVWQDQAKGVVRLPINDAMELVENSGRTRRRCPLEFDCPGGKGDSSSAQGSRKAQPV